MTAELIDELLPPGKVVFFVVPDAQAGGGGRGEVQAPEGEGHQGPLARELPSSTTTSSWRSRTGRRSGRPCAIPARRAEDDDTPVAWRNPKGCDKCPAFAWCESQGYEAQFREKADVYVLAHNYLYLPKRKELPDPDLIVIDESFLGHATAR